MHSRQELYHSLCNLIFCVSVFSVPQALFEENENIAQSPEELWVQARMAPCLT